MLVLMTILGGVALFLAMRVYANSDRMLPDFSTPEGRNARLAVGGIWLLYIVTLGTYIFSGGTGSENIMPWISAFIFGGSVPLLSYVKFRRGRKR